MKKQVSERAVMARLNRRLRKDNQQIRKTRDNSRWLVSQGDFFIIDLATKIISDDHVDLDYTARDLGALAAYEEVAA